MIRYPYVAGTFYPLRKEELERMIEHLLSQAEDVEGSMRGAIVPHAGYIYSGRTAAYVYRNLKGKKFVIVGPNHTGLGAPLSVFPRGEWITPLGGVPVDEELALYILKQTSMFVEDVEAHIEEHSIEVQLPFLQYTQGEFSFVPITMLLQTYEAAKDLADGIPDDVIFLASSDFSHYVPAEIGKKMDEILINRILNLDAKGFLRSIEETGATPCGYGPIASIILWARRMGLKPKLLHFSHSGMVNGDESSVVDYASIGFFE